MNFFEQRLAFITKYLPSYIEGVGLTLLLSAVAVIFGCLLGLLVARARLGKSKPVSLVATAFVEVIRGTPMLVQLTMFYFTMIQIIPPQYTLLRDKILLGGIAISINSAAYISEVIRSGLQSVDKGQTEAARSLGLNESQTMRYIILPQAVKNILPALVNEFVTLIKESSIVSFIGLHDLMYYANAARTATYKAFEPLLYAAFIYFVLTFTLSKVMAAVERRLDR